MSEPGKLTILDVARLAGVSRSTVSRVMNGRDDVRPEVRARVLQVIDETGFRPSNTARSLVSRRTGVLGLVIPWRVSQLLEDPYFVRLIRGVSRASNAAGTTLSLFLFETEEEEAELYRRVVSPRLVDGLMLVALRKDDPLLDEVANSDLPMVSLGRVMHRDDVSWADVENFEGARRAVQHLVGLGHTSIAAIAPPQQMIAGIDRYDGFTAGMRDAGLDAQFVEFGDWSRDGGYAAMRKLLHRQPTAVFVASDTMAMGALRAINDSGLSVPDDLAIVGFDGLPASERSRPPLTTLRQPIPQIGETLINILLDQIDTETREPVRRLIPTELIVRESSGRSHSAAPAGKP
ncbi:MAG TPA: LacI family DNA-binding transcriptional regulator [Micromonosporaceae bacterium]|nr:LacI family DNA-binding transcriptional regulator [Micromonosporaceae bacterium]